MNIKHKRFQPVIAIIICIALFSVLFFSIFYISHEANHDCTGKDCPICFKIQACIQTIATIGSAIITASSTSILLLCIALSPAVCKANQIVFDTLVSLKVKLSN